MKRNNLLKNIITSTFVKGLFLLLSIVHLTFGHVVLQSFVICIEKDGSIAIESLSDKDICCDASPSEKANDFFGVNSSEDCDDCNDIEITDNCVEDCSVISKKAEIKLTIVFCNVSNHLAELRNKYVHKIIDINEIKNPAQLSYSRTIQLLI